MALPLAKPRRLGALPARWPLPPPWKPHIVVALKICLQPLQRSNRLKSLVDVLAFDLFLKMSVLLGPNHMQHRAPRAEFLWHATSTTTGQLTRRAISAVSLSKRIMPLAVAAGSLMANMLATRRRQPLMVILKCDSLAEIR